MGAPEWKTGLGRWASLSSGPESIPDAGEQGPAQEAKAAHGGVRTWELGARWPRLDPAQRRVPSSETHQVLSPVLHHKADSRRPSPFVPVPRPGAWLPLATTADAQVGVQPRLLSRAQPGVQDLPPGRPTVALTSYLVRPPFQPCVVASMVLLNRNEVTALGDSALPIAKDNAQGPGSQGFRLSRGHPLHPSPPTARDSGPPRQLTYFCS